MTRLLCSLLLVAYASAALYCAALPDSSTDWVWPSHKTRMALNLPPKGLPR